MTTDVTLDTIDRALNNLCPCGNPPRDGSAYCSYDCEPNHISIHTDTRDAGEPHATPMRWRPDLVTATPNDGLTLLVADHPRGHYNATIHRRDNTGALHFRLDDGCRLVGIDVPDGTGDEHTEQCQRAWARLERQLADTRYTDQAPRDRAVRRQAAQVHWFVSEDQRRIEFTIHHFGYDDTIAMAAFRQWLQANHIDPDAVPLRHPIVIDGNTLTVPRHPRDDTGEFTTDPATGDRVIERRTVPLQQPLPRSLEQWLQARAMAQQLTAAADAWARRWAPIETAILGPLRAQTRVRVAAGPIHAGQLLVDNGDGRVSAADPRPEDWYWCPHCNSLATLEPDSCGGCGEPARPIRLRSHTSNVDGRHTFEITDRDRRHVSDTDHHADDRTPDWHHARLRAIQHISWLLRARSPWYWCPTCARTSAPNLDPRISAPTTLPPWDEHCEHCHTPVNDVRVDLEQDPSLDTYTVHVTVGQGTGYRTITAEQLARDEAAADTVIADLQRQIHRRGLAAAGPRRYQDDQVDALTYAADALQRLNTAQAHRPIVNFDDLVAHYDTAARDFRASRDLAQIAQQYGLPPLRAGTSLIAPPRLAHLAEVFRPYGIDVVVSDHLPDGNVYIFDQRALDEAFGRFIRTVTPSLRSAADGVRHAMAGLSGLAERFEQLRQVCAEHQRQEQVPTDPRERALWLRHNRNTGPVDRRRAPRRIDPRRGHR